MNGLQPGDLVDVTIRAAIVESASSRQIKLIVVHPETDEEAEISIPLTARGIAVSLVAKDWPPEPGDVWQADEDQHTAYYFARDVSNLDDDPPGTELRMVGVSEYADSDYTPRELARRARVRLVYRPEPTAEGGGRDA